MRRRIIGIWLVACWWMTPTHAQISENDVELQQLFIDAKREMLLGNDEEADSLFREVLKKDKESDAAAFELARIHSTRKEYDKALGMIEKAMDWDPDNPWYPRLASEIYEKLDRFEDAAEVNKDLAQKFPQEDYYYARWAFFLVKAGKVEDAMQVYEIMEKEVGISEEIIRRKHTLYVGLGEKKKAAQELERLIDAYPSDISYRHLLADYYLQIGKEEEAAAVYRAILDLSPEDTKARLALAGEQREGSDSQEIQFVRGLMPVFEDPDADIDLKVKRIIPLMEQAVQKGQTQLAKALLDLTTTLERVHPREAKGYAASADLLHSMGRLEEARLHYEQALDLDETVYAVWEQYLYVLMAEGAWQLLTERAEDAMDIYPNRGRLYLLEAAAFNRLGEFQDAIDLLNQALMMSGRDELLKLEIHVQAGLAYDGLEDFQTSDKAFEQALSIQPESPLVLSTWSLQLADRNQRLDYAEKLAKKAHKIAPGHPLVQHSQAWIAYRAKDYEAAEMHFQKAMSVAPNWPDLYEHYGDLLFQTGEEEEAVQYWKKAKEMGSPSRVLNKKIADRQLYE